ncbi:MAG: hypothetical protein GX023_07255 [Tissierellia bacterium]|nr:hypothetical protein [Tissierellia bacterium]
MRKFAEKFLIILFCLYNTYKINPDKNLAFYFLISLILSLLLDLLHTKKRRISLYILFIMLCFFDNLFIFYLPLILYNIYLDFGIYTILVTPLILMISPITNLMVSIISIYFSEMSKKYKIILTENKIVRDKLTEDNIYLKKYNEQLKIDKEKNIQIAILTERNRIARELHDSIGHAISSSILQVEALKIISNENAVISGLNTLQNTLSNGMEDIRKNIHNLYSESLELKSQIEKLCREIPNIDTEIIYNLEDDLDYNLKFDILSIVKEAITNCIKHSNATKLKITLLSQPKFYSIVIKDNGSIFDENVFKSSKGIGLMSMEDIAKKHNGFLNYKFDDGFQLHLTLMKGDTL